MQCYGLYGVEVVSTSGGPIKCMLRTLGYRTPWKLLSPADQFQAKYFVGTDVLDQGCRHGVCNTFSFAPLIKYAAGEPVSRDYLDWVVMTSKLNNVHKKRLSGRPVIMDLGFIDDDELAETIHSLGGIYPKGTWVYKDGYSGSALRKYFEVEGRKLVAANDGGALTAQQKINLLKETGSKFFLKTNPKYLIPLKISLKGREVLAKNIQSFENEIVKPLKKALSNGKPQRISFKVNEKQLSDKHFQIINKISNLNGPSHSMAIVGYTDNAKNRYGPAFIIQNSWGTDDGYKGVHYITVEELKKLKDEGNLSVTFHELEEIP